MRGMLNYVYNVRITFKDCVKYIGKLKKKKKKKKNWKINFFFFYHLIILYYIKEYNLKITFLFNYYSSETMNDP
jgi:hypothetical protein